MRRQLALLFVWFLVFIFPSGMAIAASIQYTYDSLNRLVKVQYANGTVISYSYDSAGNRTVRSVTVPNAAPNIPSNPSPASGATGVSFTSVNLSWTGGDSNSVDSVTYNVYFGTTNAPTAIDSPGQSGTSFNPGILNPGTTYFWKIIAKDQNGAQTAGPVWSFTTHTGLKGDLNADGSVDRIDLSILEKYLNQPASACPACDIDGNGTINVLDARKLVLLCTRPYCATP